MFTLEDETHLNPPLRASGSLSTLLPGSSWGRVSVFPAGPGLNEEGNDGAHEGLKQDERLIGFVDHLSTKKEAGGAGTPQDVHSLRHTERKLRDSYQPTVTHNNSSVRAGT
ncbi:hypothetical protein Q8A73_022691 [Channa argus]|nr:hypothetical protein Q8A73_022691 [Channa argus]